MDINIQAELRRKRILANAEARLKKIRRITLEEVEKECNEKNSKSSEISLKDNKEDGYTTKKITLSEVSDDSENNICMNEAKSLTNGGLCNGSHGKTDNESTVTQLSLSYNHEINSGVNPQSMPNAGRMPTLSETKRQVFLDLFIFIILGILIRLLYSIGLSSIFLNNILGPFLVVCLPRVILFIKEKPELPLMYSLILFLGVKESRIKMPFRVLSCLRTTVQYLALYLFSFFVTHCVIKEFLL